MEPGTGKTLLAIAVSGKRFLRGEIKRLLIIAPKSVLPVWEEEFEEKVDFPYYLEVLDQRKVRQRYQRIRQWRDKPGLNVIVINYDSVPKLRSVLEKWIRGGMIILDESQRIKNGRAKRSKAIHKLGDKAKYRMILTGTPITQSPLDIFSQYLFLDPEIFGRKFIPFRNRYAIMGGYKNYKVKRYIRLDELSRKAYTIAYRVTKKEALDLPPITHRILPCYLERSKKYYDEMDKELTLTLSETETIVSPIVLTKMLRCQQITGGFITRDPMDEEGKKETIWIGNEKLEVLKDFLEDFPKHKKIVIVARFIPEIEAIEKLLKKLGISVLTLHGKTKNRKEVIQKFRKTDTRALVFQIRTGGLGITLTEADTIIFYSKSFSYEDYDQAISRVYRQTQKNKVTVYHLIAKGTIDEDIQEAIEQKKDLATYVVDILRGGVNKMAKSKIRKRRIGVNPTEDLLMTQALRRLKTQIEEGRSQIDVEPQKSEDLAIEVDMSTTEKEDKEKGPKKKHKNRDEKPKIEGPVVTIKDLADELGMEPTVLRKKLRNSDIKKPGGRWEWPENHPDLEIIRRWKE